MSTRQLKWAAGGFAGGFLLCYVLIGTFRPTPPAPRLLTEATLVTAPPPVIAVVTNVQLPEPRMPSSERRLDRVPGMPAAPQRPGYSLDLIDTHYTLPERP